ncbi:MAG: HipA domain-containing protein [Oscillospiraceae bacterium]|nr:HipA domain-containing protein [Oscillospiraceae bacterium]
MIEITIPESNFVTLGGSSRGYAKKAPIGDLWYKVSAGAFNAQAEVVASRLAAYTNLGSFVTYEMCLVNGEYATVSKDYIRARRYETLKGLHARVTGTPIESVSQHLSGAELLRYTRNLVLSEIGYDMLAELSMLLQFDALVQNEDRHFNNIMFMQENGKWEMAPAFDFDCTLYSCVEDLTKLKDYKSPALPYCKTHKEQLELMYSVSDVRLKLMAFDIEEITSGVWEDRHQIGKNEVANYLNQLKGELENGTV